MTRSLAGTPIDNALSLSEAIPFIKRPLWLVIILFLIFEPNGLAYRWDKLEHGLNYILFHTSLQSKYVKKYFIKLSYIIIFILGFLLSRNIISNDIPVGQLADFTGPTSSVGKPFGQGHIDAIKWINKNGGINMKIRVDTVDIVTRLQGL